MKDYIIPYMISKTQGWWGGIDIYNHNNVETSITTKVQRPSEVVANIRIDKIIPFGHLVLAPDDLNKNVNEAPGRITVIITGPENLMITPFMGCTDSNGVTNG